MGNTIAASSGVGLGTIEAMLDQDSSEQNKINKLARNSHHQQRMTALDKKIGQLTEAKNQTTKASNFKLISGVIGTILSTASKLLDLVAPGLGELVSGVISAVTKGIQAMNPHYKKVEAAKLDAEKFEKEAEKASYWCQTDQENISAERENRETIKRHLEKAMENNQQAQSVAVRA